MKRPHRSRPSMKKNIHTSGAQTATPGAAASAATVKPLDDSKPPSPEATRRAKAASAKTSGHAKRKLPSGKSAVVRISSASQHRSAPA